MPNDLDPNEIIEELIQPLGKDVVKILSAVPGEIRVLLPSYAFSWAAELLVYKGARFLIHTGLDTRLDDGHFRIVTYFDLQESFFSLETQLDDKTPSYPALTEKIPAAHWAEREIHDLLGVYPENHPYLQPLVLHDLPESIYPLRYDFSRQNWPPALPKPFLPNWSQNSKIESLSLGPLQNASTAPGLFFFQNDGQIILSMEAQRFYSHRGVEKQIEGLHFEEAITIVERICAPCSVSHAYSFCAAIERISRVEAPVRARALRIILLEFERILSHINDLNQLCQSLFAHQAIFYASTLKETLSQLAAKTFGHRRLMNTVQVGGVRRDLTENSIKLLQEELKTAKSTFEMLEKTIRENDSLQERLLSLGTLSSSIANSLGTVGIVARASGIPYDARQKHPYDGYKEFPIESVPVGSKGDAATRTHLRLEEVKESFSLLEKILQNLPSGPLTTEIQNTPEELPAVGYAESPKGETCTYLLLGPSQTIRRYRLRSASYCNWSSLPATLVGSVLEDFSLVEKSFALCSACTER